MIVLYCLLTCLCGYLAAIGGVQSFKDIQKLFGTRFQQRNSTAQSTCEKAFGPSIRQPLQSQNVGPQIEKSEEVGQSRRQSKALSIGNNTQQRKRRIIVAMTGATGAILGIRILEKLRQMDIETHLVISKWADATISYETDYKLSAVRALATKVYSSRDVAAPISSGSFKVDAMIVVPCSMKTLSGIATGYSEDLISRAADVTFKERRRLILVARETPLSGIHLENMVKVTQNGAIIFPPVPAFYMRPQTVNEIVDQTVGRILDLIDVDTGDFERWNGMHKFGKG